MQAERSSTRTHTLSILAVALLLRLVVLWDVLANLPRGWFFTRGMEMGLLAKSLLASHGLASPFGPPTGPTAFIAPGYPLLVALVYRLFGIDSTASAVVILSAQIVVNLVIVWLILHLARNLFDERAAVVAGLIWACSPPLLWIPTIFWDTSLGLCLLLGMLALALRLRTGAGLRTWMLLGAYCAVAALINPALLPVLLAILCWLAWQTLEDRRGLPFALLTFALLFSPWPIRNAHVFHTFIPLRTTVGFELWMGNRPGATGFYDESFFPTFNQSELANYRSMGEVAYTADKSHLARQFISSHPGTFLMLTAERIARYWFGTGNKASSALYPMHAALTSFLGLVGLSLLAKEKSRSTTILLALPLLLFPLPYYMTHAEFRYRLMLDPLLTILAAYAVTALLRRSLKKKRHSGEARIPVSRSQPQIP